MKTTRRGFVKTIGLGTAAAGLVSGSALWTPSLRAQTREAHRLGVYDGGIINLDQNESARGPGPATLEAIRIHNSKRIGRGYAPDHVPEFEQGLADYYNLQTANVQIATGSTPLLQGAVRAFCSMDRGFVTPVPTYATSEATARAMGVPITQLDLDSSLSVDLDALAEASRGAGLVYLCNPNNPTGTVHGPAAIEAFVRRVMAESPETRIHIDEAYINYVDPGVMETALPLAMEFENVFITRSFSKAHGLAGMRIGYGLGQQQTLAAIRDAWGMGDVSMLSAVAALTALEDKEHIEWERQENARVKAFTLAGFKEMGYEVPYSHTNHIFVNIRQPAAQFRAACLAQNVRVGRDFPPLAQAHCRISLGSMEEMEIAMQVFRKVLTG